MVQEEEEGAGTRRGGDGKCVIDVGRQRRKIERGKEGGGEGETERDRKDRRDRERKDTERKRKRQRRERARRIILPQTPQKQKKKNAIVSSGCLNADYIRLVHQGLLDAIDPVDAEDRH